MLTPRPFVLKELVQRYEALQEQYSVSSDAGTRQRMNDAAYTLCVTTGTRDVETALLIARRQIEAVDTAETEPA